MEISLPPLRLTIRPPDPLAPDSAAPPSSARFHACDRDPEVRVIVRRIEIVRTEPPTTPGSG